MIHKRFSKHLAKLTVCLLFCAVLSPIAHGVRTYSETADSVDRFSRAVSRYETQHFDGEADHTLIVRTDGTKPDFRTLHPQYSVQGPDDTYVVCFADEAQAQESLVLLNRTDGVLYAEPNGVVYAQTEAGDYSPHSWGVDYLQTRAVAEQLAQKTLTTVTVGVVDSGIAADHPQFENRIAGGDSFLSDPYNVDRYGHGTCVAGVVADCTQGLPVEFRIVKVLDDTGRGSLLNAANGIRLAAEQGAQIINLSFVTTSCSQYLHDAVHYAMGLGSLPVIAAGNYTLNMDKSTCCPAHMTEPVVVSGCDQNGERYKKSCYGSTVDLCAPAVAVECAFPDGGYASQNGTSFAAPHISAVAALYKLCDPDADCTRLTALLLEHTRDLGEMGYDPYFGWGVPDLSDFDISGCVVTAVRVETLPQKTEYVYKEAFDATGLSVRVSYADGTQSVRSYGLKITGADALQRGDNEITVSYGGQSDTFSVFVKLEWWQWLIKILLFGWIWY